MLVAVWIALGVGVAAVAGGTALVVSRAIGAWRSLRSFARGARDAVAAVEAKAAAGEQRAASLVRKSGDTTTAVTRLETSLATLAVLRAAAGEAGGGLRRVRALVTRK